jgi:hypothetical protein
MKERDDNGRFIKQTNELEQVKKCLKDKDERINILEVRAKFWRMIGWGTIYLFVVLIPVSLGILHMWITIASNSRYNVLNFDLRYGATGWVLSSDAWAFLLLIMTMFYAFVYSCLVLLWCILWEDSEVSHEYLVAY